MPTGYTVNIKDGITFRKFALNCARNFGAAIALRDDDSSVEVTPENVKFGTNYHQKALSAAKSAQNKFKKLTRAQKRKMFKTETDRILENCRRTDITSKSQKKSYLAMLEKVKNWQPPTKDHKNMKDFMTSQITESIDFDCDTKYNNERIIETVTQTYPEWLKSKKEKLTWDIQYHQEHLEKDIARDNERSSWIKQLIDSLPDNS